MAVGRGGNAAAASTGPPVDIGCLRRQGVALDAAPELASEAVEARRGGDLARPVLENIDSPKEGGWVIKLQLPVYPEVKLGDYKNNFPKLDLPSPPGMMRSMRRKIAQALVVFTLVCVIGGHWAFLQSLAWVGMAINYSHESSLKEALVKTFDGQHPCKICKVVREGKKSEHKQTFQKLETKFDFWLTRPLLLVEAPPPFAVLPSEMRLLHARAESPPIPPPRSA